MSTGMVNIYKTGRELDCLIAEHVFGLWESVRLTLKLPKYSTSLDAAWRIVERLESLGWSVAIGRPSGSLAWTVSLQKGDDADSRYTACWDSLPLSICRAGLMVILGKRAA